MRWWGINYSKLFINKHFGEARQLNNCWKEVQLFFAKSWLDRLLVEFLLRNWRLDVGRRMLLVWRWRCESVEVWRSRSHLTGVTTLRCRRNLSETRNFHHQTRQLTLKFCNDDGLQNFKNIAEKYLKICTLISLITVIKSSQNKILGSSAPSQQARGEFFPRCQQPVWNAFLTIYQRL